MSYSDDAQTADPANNNNNNNNETPIRNNPLLRSANPLVSDLEQEVLDEYARLLDNVNKVCPPPPPPQPFPTPLFFTNENEKRVHVANITGRYNVVSIRPGPPRRRPGLGDARRPAPPGAQDGDRVHPAQGQRVQHRAAAADL